MDLLPDTVVRGSTNRPFLPAAAAVLALLAAQLPASQQRLDGLDLFDAIGLPSVDDAPFVRVATGLWMQTGRQPKTNRFVYGFVLEDRGETFEVLTEDRLRETFTRTPRGTPDHERVGYEPVELRVFVRALLADPSPGEDPGLAPRRHQALPLAFYAWACRAKGDDRNARALVDAALVAFRASVGRGQRAPAGDLRGFLADDLGNETIWRLVVDFGDPSVPYRELHDRVVRFLEVFPGHRHAGRAEKTERILARMLADAAARPAPRAPLDELTPAEQARELVFRLREQNGRQWSQPGSCDVFADPRGEDSPAAKLRALGLPAVPALADALDDDSFTRSVGFHRDFYFSHRVLPVSECARVVLSEITGAWFGSADAARAWLADVRERGEKAVWIDGTRAGNLAHAMRLVLHHPEDAWPPIRDAFENPKTEEWSRALLVALAGTLEDPGALAFVHHQLVAGETIRCRLNAAAAMLERDRDAVIDAVIATWRAQTPPDPDGEAAHFLAATGDARAIDALAERVDVLDDDVLQILGTGHAWLTGVQRPNGEGGWRSVGQIGPEEWHAEALAAVERVCLRALESRQTLNGNYGGVSNPRIADFAADALHHRWPDRYVFVFEAPRRLRDRQLLTIRNAARVARGEPPLEDVDAVVVQPVPAERVEPLLTRFRRVELDADRERIAGEILDLGVGALPHVARAIDTADREDRPALKELARRLAGVVAAARFHSRTEVHDDAIDRKLAAMRGRPADPDAVLAIASDIVSAPLKGVGGFVLDVEREAEGLGIIVTLRLLADREPEAGPWTSAQSSVHCAVGVRGLLQSTGAGQLGAYQRAGRMDDFADALREALAEPFWDAAIEARMSIRFRR